MQSDEIDVGCIAKSKIRSKNCVDAEKGHTIWRRTYNINVILYNEFMYKWKGLFGAWKPTGKW